MARNVSNCWRAVATRSSSNTHTSYPRLLMRAQGDLDLLRGQEMDKTFCLFLLSNSAYVSHVVDAWRACAADRARTASGRSLALLREPCERGCQAFTACPPWP